MKVDVLRLLHEEQSRPTGRPVLRGTSVSGNAWDEYEAALGLSAAMSPEDQEALDRFISFGRTQWHSIPNRRTLDSLLLRAAPALSHLQAGAIRRDAWYHGRTLDGVLLKIVNVFSVYRLAYLAEAKARTLSDDGRGREAADLLLDLAQLGRDGLFVEGPSSPSGWYLCLDVATRQLRALILSIRLTPEDLLDVERGLEALDRSSRRFLPMEATEIQEFGFEFLEAEDLSAAVRKVWEEEYAPGAVKPRKLWDGWRFGFSDRMMVADAFDEGLAYVRRCERLEGASWSEVRHLGDLLEKEALANRNPIVSSLIRRKINAVSMRLPLARIRLLRVAAHYKATGEFLDVEDPYGGTLRRAEDACRWRIWSVGYDGVDNGGWGDWGTRYTPLIDVALLMDR